MSKGQKAKPRSEMTPEQLAHVRQYQREWRKKNAERYYEKQRKRRADPKSGHKEWAAKWREKNRDRLNEKARDWARRNPEKHKEKFLVYLNRNRAKRYEDWGHREAVRRGCVIGDRDAVREVYQRAIDLSKETGVRWSVDHIIPLGLGGAHSIENVQAMLHDLNQTKSGNPFWICENGEYKDWRDVPFSTWPDKFLKIYNAVASHVESGRPFYSMTA